MIVRDRPSRTRNEDIAEMARNGVGFAQIGRHFGITRERVRQIANSRGVKHVAGTKMRDRREAIEQRRAARAELAARVRYEIEGNGLSWKAAAAKLGLNRGSIEKIIIRNGIRSRHHSGNPNFRKARA